MEQIPKTIEELKQWYIDRNLPSESVTRFFIGSNYKGAKAFGIYKDEVTDKYVVYKNKADGSRSIRYEGMDEAYAVNELYKKLKAEIYNQKNNNPENYRDNASYSRKSIKLVSLRTIIIIYILIIVLICFFAIKSPRKGYYNYNDNYYYYQSGSWYIYNNKYESWNHVTAPDAFKDDCSDYYTSSNYSYSYGIDDFEDSVYYESTSSSSGDYDSDYDWDSSDSWDSDYSDWDSDW